MSRRKGELSLRAIDAGWPHQVALPEHKCVGRFEALRAFCSGLSLCSRGHSVRHDDISYQVFCFAEPEDAQSFREAFQGVPFYPEDRGRGLNWWKWDRPPGDVRRRPQ